MRLTDLLGYRVTDATGTAVGRVADVRVIEDGLRIDGLIIVERHATQLFGYERHVGPALLRWLVHRHLGGVWYLPWRDVAEIADETVTLRSSRAELQPLEELARY
ncbi:hypothetical protein GCM10009745_58510 [Kribbella yunnanensis]|uniref:PRC-barrel domain containing protein n=1 Tax=Kribbella yunnanensis TaxID=190194 RepID=A0ABP4UEA6_9ACTN